MNSRLSNSGNGPQVDTETVCHIAGRLDSPIPAPPATWPANEWGTFDLTRVTRYSRVMTGLPQATQSVNSSRNTRVLTTCAFGAGGGLVGALLGEMQFTGDSYRFFQRTFTSAPVSGSCLQWLE